MRVSSTLPSCGVLPRWPPPTTPSGSSATPHCAPCTGRRRMPPRLILGPYDAEHSRLEARMALHASACYQAVPDRARGPEASPRAATLVLKTYTARAGWDRKPDEQIRQRARAHRQVTGKKTQTQSIRRQYTPNIEQHPPPGRPDAQVAPTLPRQ